MGVFCGLVSLVGECWVEVFFRWDCLVGGFGGCLLVFVCWFCRSEIVEWVVGCLWFWWFELGFVVS